MAVVTTIELNDLVSLGESPRKTDSRHGCLRPRIAHPHLLYAGHQGTDQFSHCDFRRVGNAEARSLFGSGLDGFDDLRVGMAKNCRAPSANVINVLISIHVP